jgi:hypothetical protein
MKKWFALGMVALFLLTVGTSSTCSAMASAEKDVVAKEVLEVIEGYYAYAYGAIGNWASKELPDLSPYMHMDEIQCQNTSMYVASCIFNMIFEAEELRHDPPDTLYPYSVKLLSVEQPSATEAVAKIRLDLDRREAYPLFMLHGENTFKLRSDGGKWKITEWQSEENKDTPLIKASFSTKELKKTSFSDDFESSYEEAKFRIRKNKLGTCYTDPQDKVETQDEQKNDQFVYHPYDRVRAKNYANSFVDDPNGYFYVALANGDCTNFVSQCISYGFGVTSGYSSETSYRMDRSSTYYAGWYGGSGGGSYAWETVGPLGDYLLSDKITRGPISSTTSLGSMENGDVLQISFQGSGLSHSVICVDASQKKFASHSPNQHVYWSHYENCHSHRFIELNFFMERAPL